MASRVRYPLKCKCGHTGELVLKENDTPYSSSWEEYSTISFDSDGYQVQGRTAGFQELFKEMPVKCPQCGTRLTEANLAEGK